MIISDSITNKLSRYIYIPKSVYKYSFWLVIYQRTRCLRVLWGDLWLLKPVAFHADILNVFFCAVKMSGKKFVWNKLRKKHTKSAYHIGYAKNSENRDKSIKLPVSAYKSESQLNFARTSFRVYVTFRHFGSKEVLN